MFTNEAYLNYLRECQSGVLAEIILGAFKASDDGQRCICSIYLAGESFLVPSHTDRVSAFLRPDPASGRLLIHFLNCSISDSVRKKYFDKGSFLIENGYPLGGQVARELNFVEGSHWICTGDYPLLDDGELLTASVGIGRIVALPVALPIQRVAA